MLCVLLLFSSDRTSTNKASQPQGPALCAGAGARNGEVKPALQNLPEITASSRCLEERGEPASCVFNDDVGNCTYATDCLGFWIVLVRVQCLFEEET